jgi:hypothetical protein
MEVRSWAGSLYDATDGRDKAKNHPRRSFDGRPTMDAELLPEPYLSYDLLHQMQSGPSKRENRSYPIKRCNDIVQRP